MRDAAKNVRASQNHVHLCGTTCVVVSSLSWSPMHACDAMLSVERLPIPVHSRSGDLLIVSRKFFLCPSGGISGHSPVDRSNLSSVHADGD